MHTFLDSIFEQETPAAPSPRRRAKSALWKKLRKEQCEEYDPPPSAPSIPCPEGVIVRKLEVFGKTSHEKFRAHWNHDTTAPKPRRSPIQPRKPSKSRFSSRLEARIKSHAAAPKCMHTFHGEPVFSPAPQKLNLPAVVEGPKVWVKSAPVVDSNPWGKSYDLAAVEEAKAMVAREEEQLRLTLKFGGHLSHRAECLRQAVRYLHRVCNF